MEKYINETGNIVSSQQAIASGRYRKLTYENEVLIQEMWYLSGNLYSLKIYNNDNQEHEEIYLELDMPLITIVDIFPYSGDYIKHVSTSYGEDRTPQLIRLEFYNEEMKCISHEVSDENGIIDYSYSYKQYWKEEWVSHRPILRTEYEEDGSLKLCLVNLSTDHFLSDQNADSYDNTPEDITLLSNKVEISEEWAAFFLNTDPFPDFLSPIS